MAETLITVGTHIPTMAVDYHSEIGFPENVPMPTGHFPVEPSGHARKEASNDRYGGFKLPKFIKLTDEMYESDPRQSVGGETKAHVFEVTVENGHVKKLGLRKHYDENRDIILIVRPYKGTIVTAWINVKDDPHQTLDESNYATP